MRASLERPRGEAPVVPRVVSCRVACGLSRIHAITALKRSLVSIFPLFPSSFSHKYNGFISKEDLHDAPFFASAPTLGTPTAPSSLPSHFDGSLFQLMLHNTSSWTVPQLTCAFACLRISKTSCNPPSFFFASERYWLHSLPPSY